jgi:hypothetical protein
MDHEKTMTMVLLVGLVQGPEAQEACTDMAIELLYRHFPQEEHFAVVKRCKARALATYRAGPEEFLKNGLVLVETLATAETSEAIH